MRVRRVQAESERYHQQNRHRHRDGDGNERDNRSPRTTKEKQNRDAAERDGRREFLARIAEQDVHEMRVIVRDAKMQARMIAFELRDLFLNRIDHGTRTCGGVLNHRHLYSVAIDAFDDLALAIDEIVAAPLLARGVGDGSHVFKVDYAPLLRAQRIIGNGTGVLGKVGKRG